MTWWRGQGWARATLWCHRPFDPPAPPLRLFKASVSKTLGEEATIREKVPEPPSSRSQDLGDRSLFRHLPGGKCPGRLLHRHRCHLHRHLHHRCCSHEEGVVLHRGSGLYRFHVGARCCAALHSSTNNLHVLLGSYWLDNLGFFMRENLLLCASHLPLGVPNGRVHLRASRTCYNCDEESHFANECPYEKRVDKPKFIKGVKPRLKPNPINDRYKRNKGRAFVGAEYLSDEEEEDEEKEAGVAGLAFSKPGSLFTYDYSKDYSTENDVGSSFMARTTQDDDSDDSTSSTIVGSCLMARETKVMEPPPSLSSVLDDEAENQEELTVLKELYNVRCTLRGEALVKFDFLMDSLKEKDESIEELEYHLNDKERRFNLLRQELKTERCISQGLKQQIETYELDKVKDLETIERAQSLTQELNASKEELEVAHASLTRDLDHLERANKLVKDELKKLGKNHDLLQETYSKALESMNDSIVDKDVASSSTTFTSEHAKLVAEHVRLQEELSLHVETNTYLESLVTKYGLNYYPNESACEQATTLEENVRLKKELAKFTTTKNKMGLDDLLSKQRSNNQKYGLGYDPKPYKKNNYKKEKPAQEKNKKVTNDGKAPKGKATSGDRTGPNNHYALFVDYYGDVYANYVGPRNGYAYRGYSIWGYSSGGPKWVFDSGCTNHMTGGRGVLDQFIEDINKKSSITFGDNSKGKVLGYGKVAISKDLCLETVMLVEHLGYNLLSIYHLADAGYNSYFTKYYVQVFRSDNLKLVLVGYVENNLYVVDLSKESPSPSTCLMAAKHDEGWLWHRRLGHVNMRNLKQLLKGEHIVGLTDISFEKDRVCSACVAGKQLKKKHPIKSIVTTSRPLELLHLDLFGPSHYDTLGGSKYGLVIVDDYSRYSWVFLLKSKDETHREFITFAKKAQRTYESEIKAIRTDNGTEFKNYTMQEFVDDEGIKHEFSAPYTPQQNGVVERKNRTIIEMARTMLSEFNSPHNFWGEAISTAVHYSNRLFLRPLHNKTPYELLTGNKPNVMYIRVFGCKCLVKNNKGKLGKFETRTIEGIFVGYAENSHAYRYYNRSTGTIEVSCDVVFLEDNGSQVEQVVPCVAGNDDDPSSAIKHMGIGHIRPMEVHNDDQGDGVEVSSSPQVEPSSTQVEPSSATQDLSSTQDEPHPEEQEESPQPTEQDHDDDQETSSTHVQAQVVPHDQVLARDEFIDHEGTIRKIKAATRASDMKVDQVLGSISKGVVTRRHHALLITYCQHHAFVSSFEPLKVHEALVDPDWVIAMQEELECFTRNEVWSLVERPKDHRINVIGTKWVFKNKQDENGIVIRNKARHSTPDSSMAAADLGTAEWERSKITNQDLNLLKKLGITTKPKAVCFPSEESYPAPPMGYRVSFVDHLIRGLSTPIHPFLRGLLYVYGLQLHHLTPNSILHISIFITLCEAFLGVSPNWALWKRIFFCRRNGSPNVAYNIGGVVISIRSTADYFDVKLPDSVQGWRKRWLYIREENDGCLEDNIPPFDGAEKILRRRSWDAEATEEERTSTESLMARIHELQNTRGKELSGIQIIVYFLKSRVQPLQARKFPLWKYTGNEDVDRLSVDLEVKDLERLVRKITSLSKKDAIPSSCRVKPYSATHALPKPVIKDLLRIGAQFVGYREYANKAEEKLAEANDRANTLAQQLEQSEKARKKAESDAIDARAEADKAKADAAGVEDLRKRLHTAETSLSDHIAAQSAREEAIRKRLTTQSRRFVARTAQEFQLDEPANDSLLDALSLLEVHGSEARGGIDQAKAGLSRLFPYFFPKKEEPATFLDLAKCFNPSEDLGLRVRHENMKIAVENTVALVAHSQQSIDWSKVGDTDQIEQSRWRSLIKAAKPNTRKILAYIGIKPSSTPSSSKPEV
ncbi:hypothetical protein QYE76_010878 [Lolium multiflorum]|uniref:Gag-pol polyprotein n=1 Tax=Lolium multiflorum TaxID=4521 RepID=A0AAD8TVW6_LOLMU|nr:hypothetical protein QYE76_010878 [Lolium multiflorum]